MQGINNLQAQYLEEFPQYGPEMNFVPYVPVTYWGFRLMIGLGMIAALYALWALWAFRGGRTPKGRFASIASATIVLFPLFGHLRRLDLHRDGPPALDRLRPADHG